MSTTQLKDEVLDFIYEPLPNADSYIRLITILDFDDTRRIPIHCKLTTWPISALPSYHAISYTWGNANDPATILINGKRMQVSQNCEHTLRQATWYGGDFRRRHYWVDAICIDQSSDEEKGPQVAHMGQIYTNAERVLACVGESTAESRYLYRRLRMDSEYYRNARYVRDGEADPVVSLREPISRTVNRTFYALRDFLLRPYFWRLWVYQELFLGREITVCCGKQHISAHVLHGLVVTQSPRLIDEEFDYTSFQSAFHLIPIPSLVLEVGVLNPAPTTLTTALVNVKRLHCTDPRDRIYGVLSTINWPNKNPIRPDYSKDRLDIAWATFTIADEEDCPDPLHVGIMWHVLESLELFGNGNASATQLGHAITKRWLRSRQLANINQGIFRNPLHHKGWCLAYEDGKWTLEGFALHKGPISIQQQSDYVRSAGLKSGLLLPSVARPGDWCISSSGYPVLIARPRLDGHFDIVGKAFTSHDQRAFHKNGIDFEVYFGSGDIINLLNSYPLSRRSDLSDDGITKYLETEVCGQPGSSYAIKVPQ